MRILLVDARPPYTYDAPAAALDELAGALRRLGHRTEPVVLPSPIRPGPGDEAAVVAVGLLNLTETYGERNHLVLASGFPAALVQHGCKLIWELRPPPAGGPLAAQAEAVLAGCVRAAAEGELAPPAAGDGPAWELLAGRLLALAPEEDR